MTKNKKDWMWWVIIGGVIGAIIFFVSDDTRDGGILGSLMWIAGFAVIGGVAYLITLLSEKIGSVLTSAIVGAIVGIVLGIFIDLGGLFENELIAFIVLVAICIIIPVGITLFRAGMDWAEDKLGDGLEYAVEKAGGAILDKFGSPVKKMFSLTIGFTTAANMEHIISWFMAKYPGGGAWTCVRQQNALVFLTGVSSIEEIATTRNFYLVAWLTFSLQTYGVTNSLFLFRERNFQEEACPFESQMTALSYDVVNTFKQIDPSVQIEEYYK